MNTETQQTAVAIVGAGVSGLIAARDLQRQGIEVLVLEAADRVGGRTLAETSALGSRLDLGGQWIGQGHHRFEQLVDQLGATRFQMHTPKAPAIFDGPQTVSPNSLPLLTATGALAAAELLSRLPVRGRWNTATVQSWLRRVPSDRARRLLGALVETTSCAGPEQLSVQAFLELVRYQGGLQTMMKTSGGAQDSLVLEGAGTLAERLAAGLGTRVRTSCRVTAIRQTADGVVLDTSAAAVAAQRAIVSVPPPMTTSITFEPPLPPERITLQRNMFMGTVYKAVAVYETPFWRARGDAECMLLGEPNVAVFDTSPPAGPGHLCMLVGGPQARALDDLDTDGRRAVLLRQLAQHLGHAVEQPASWHEKAWHQDTFAGGGYSALPVQGTSEGFYPVASAPTGRIHWAGTETAAEHAGYIEGAIEAGIRAAREVAKTIAHESQTKAH
ncbi:putative flavin-containing monoamine oxidase AofH [Mycolicibacterium sp. TY66]|uniref:flavin monoamine oxidase family protein n=1 Tax=unclassified Mycolicibacterium TaxID=2636767 RepID=UPI001BB3515D|nr:MULTISPECIES: FAD-dependent oxidoreductase [unclassified Mycolicibacterium]BCI78901.1 putative flavin-containing monoamine oxidase AofH [Mycolicibacterium sp. TY66]BCJ83438.1 putative flavin-containing monoamine oxidase AofH [Mycolicibacterium sp. TY81]